MKTSVLAGCCHNCVELTNQASEKRTTRRRADADYRRPSPNQPTGPDAADGRAIAAPDVRRGRTIPPVSHHFLPSAGPAGSACSRSRRGGPVCPRPGTTSRRFADCGSSIRLINPRQARAAIRAAGSGRSRVTAPNLLSMSPAASSSRRTSRVHPGGKFGRDEVDAGRVRRPGGRFRVRPPAFPSAADPAEDVLAAALGMPKYLVNLCFVGCKLAWPTANAALVRSAWLQLPVASRLGRRRHRSAASHSAMPQNGKQRQRHQHRRISRASVPQTSSAKLVSAG